MGAVKGLPTTNKNYSLMKMRFNFNRSVEN